MNGKFSFASVDRRGTGSMKWMLYPGDVLPMWVADMDFPVAPPIVAALQERVSHGVFGYTLPTDELLEVCCAYCRRRWNWEIEPEWIVLSPGLGVSLHTVTRYIGDPSLGLLTPEPIYHVFRNAPARGGRKRIDVPMTLAGGEWRLEPEALAEAAKANGGAAVLMLCNPHNPNGKVFTRAELERLAELALEHDWIICSDDVHADLILDPGLEHIPIASLGPEVADRCITMQSPSKAFNVAGLNFAIIVIKDEKLRERYRHGASGQVISQLNPLGMAAARAAWDGSCDEWLAGCNDHLRANRDLLSESVERLEGVEMTHLASTFLAWLDVSGLGLEDPAAHFERHGLGMSPGSVFGWPDHMRLNFGCGRDTLEQGIKRLTEGAKEALS